MLHVISCLHAPSQFILCTNETVSTLPWGPKVAVCLLNMQRSFSFWFWSLLLFMFLCRVCRKGSYYTPKGCLYLLQRRRDCEGPFRMLSWYILHLYPPLLKHQEKTPFEIKIEPGEQACTKNCYKLQAKLKTQEMTRDNEMTTYLAW